MITQSIKEVLGADLSRQVEDALKGKGKNGADVDLVVGNDGSFVPKDTYDMAVTQASQTEDTLKSVATALKDLGASGDTKNLSADVLKVKGDISTLQTTHAAEMAKLQKTTALKLGLGASVHDPDDIISRLELDKIELDEKGALKSNLDDLVNPIRESKPYLFKEAPKQEFELSGAVPGQLGGAAAGAGDADAQLIDAAFGLKGE